MRTRFAPSPTGFLHIGGVRTALFNWLLARQHGGQFILRIDDTDQQRNVEQALQPILDGFRWLGMDWDEGPEVGGPHAPYFQSQRADKYQAAVETLLEKGLAYRDYSTTEETKAEREAAEKAKQSWIYSRKWMAETDKQAAAFEAEGRTAVIRLKMPREGVCRFRDHIRGDMEFDWAREQDMVIQKANGACLYHLANVVDDHDFEITHVVRAEEHLSNTPRQIFIAQGLGYPIPEYAHLPYVAAPNSDQKLSKRKIKNYLKIKEFKELYDRGERIATAVGQAVDAETFNPVLVDFYRDTGFLPDAVLNYLLLLGWSLDGETEEFTVEEMVKHFSLERVVKAHASFDPAKLFAFQSRYFNRLPTKQKVAKVLPYLQKAGYVDSPPPCDTSPLLTQVVEAAAHRLEVAGDILDYVDFFTQDDQLPYDEKAVNKHVKKGADALQLFLPQLEQLEPFNAESLEAALKSCAETNEFNPRLLTNGLRVACTGKAVSFGVYDILVILGRERTCNRINRALEQLQ